ncbi:E3 ubiquitin-protein ligase NEDD4-like [Schistocerca gregaria]|uniref:E3 ubiquitin-protein ligase NEDD4-like n=1 Tax=Schistocerca gregaria TaxID=7010 RepID=UPI00211EC162|nr:E3 ubiquitin-protein ligase NEDD4-like [Schistocerca gregaria]XP_049851495.1 E3 ubiquitin-protein ligase NEDD4-like [Schistocerca gregaria]
MGSSQSRRTNSSNLAHRRGSSNSLGRMHTSQSLEDLANQEMERIAIECSLADAPLPPGWEQVSCHRHPTYFVDHLNMTTTYADPRFPNNVSRSHGQRKSKPPPYELNFYSKCQHLRARARKLCSERGSLLIVVRRDNLFKDSFDYVYNLNAKTFTRQLSIRFEGEKGLDYGGMSREWLLELSKEILSPKQGLFVLRDYYYDIDINSIEKPDFYDHFYFVGVVLGIAAYHGKIFSSRFTLIFYKRMMNLEPNIEDLKEYDEQIYNSLRYILEMTESVADLDLSFAIDEDLNRGSEGGFGSKTRVVSLKENGPEIPVVDENKEEYVQLCVQYYLGKASIQMEAIKNGFCQFFPQSLLNEVLTPQELRLLIEGTTEIDPRELRKYTDYQGGYTPDTPVILWLWDIIYNFTHKELRLLLQFVTGTDRVPIGGFQHLYGSSDMQHFTINKSKRQGLPSAHSCFNRLDLPEYSEKETLRSNLKYAIHETRGFDIE